MRLTVKTVHSMSVFKLVGSMNLVAGFVMSLFGLGLGGENVRAVLQQIPYIGNLLPGFFGALIIGVITGFLSGLVSALMATLYNIFAIIVGGIEIECDERSK